MNTMKRGFGLTEILMVIVILTVLYVFAGNHANSKYQSSKDIAEINWLTDLFPKSIFHTRNKQGRDRITNNLRAYNTLTTAQLVGAGSNEKTAAGRDWNVCDPQPIIPTKICIEITELSSSKMQRLRSLIQETENSYIEKPIEPASDNKLKVIYDF